MGSGCDFNRELIWSSTAPPSVEPEYYVVCGMGTGCGEGDESVALASGEHEVRCCRDSPGSGFTTKKPYCDVWARSDFDGCRGEETYAAAEGICQEYDGRLCTKEELSDRCTKGSGCGYDWELIWSSTAPPSVEPEYYVVCGMGTGCGEGDESVALAS